MRSAHIYTDTAAINPDVHDQRFRRIHFVDRSGTSTFTAISAASIASAITAISTLPSRHGDALAGRFRCRLSFQIRRCTAGSGAYRVFASWKAPAEHRHRSALARAFVSTPGTAVPTSLVRAGLRVNRPAEGCHQLDATVTTCEREREQ